MWLLDTTTYELEFFDDDREVRYAILSHRWGDGEVVFKDMEPDKNPRAKAGWDKIERACQQARMDKHQYIWIDTCGIDKSSSAELSEAINSMFRWYRHSVVCYAYLNDVEGKEASEDFMKSLWFKRGWTLQELIAPPRVIFYNRDWEAIGSRRDLGDLIGRITGIPRSMFSGEVQLDNFSVAQRMSWAAGRKTTRAEDEAYSLLGLFGVNMPMLYGEGGQRAFIRLQEEIIDSSDDQTIFAWKLEDDGLYTGLLAGSPQAFASCKETVRLKNTHRTPFRKTNMGLEISLKAKQHSLNIYHAALDCLEPVGYERSLEQIGIFLGFPAGAESANRPGRCVFRGIDRQVFKYFEFPTDNAWSREITFRVPNTSSWTSSGMPEWPHFGLAVRNFELIFKDDSYIDLSSNYIQVIARGGTWNPDEQVLTLENGTHGIAIGFSLTDQHRRPWPIAWVGFDSDFTPWVWISEIDKIRAAFKGLVKGSRRHYSQLEYHPDELGIESLDLSSEVEIDMNKKSTPGVFLRGDREVGIGRSIEGIQVGMKRNTHVKGTTGRYWRWELSIEIPLDVRGR